MIRFTHLVRIAALAAGVALGAPATAATITLDMPLCNSFSVQGTTLTCETGTVPTCQIAGPYQRHAGLGRLVDGNVHERSDHGLGVDGLHGPVRQYLHIESWRCRDFSRYRSRYQCHGHGRGECAVQRRLQRHSAVRADELHAERDSEPGSDSRWHDEPVRHLWRRRTDDLRLVRRGRGRG
jgi:hypothetical protein